MNEVKVQRKVITSYLKKKQTLKKDTPLNCVNKYILLMSSIDQPNSIKILFEARADA
jgi:hypothetical protein